MDLLFGFIIDCILGDPYKLPHPIRWVGSFIGYLDKKLYKETDDDNKKYLKGKILVLTVISLSVTSVLLVLTLAYFINFWVFFIIESILCYYMIAPKCLRKESMKVYRNIKNADVNGARKAVSMIVGRDTKCLDEKGIIKAAVETVAENTSDGVTAPIMYMTIFGAVGGIFYKSVNTCDSMIGYKNDKYMYFGRFAAKLDDVLNYIPSRITALFMIIGAGLTGLDLRNAYKIWKRDRRNHASPNSAQTEAVCAGALSVMLAGDAYYFGKLYKKKTIGDNIREIENEDIVRANRLMYIATIITLIFSVALRTVFLYFLCKLL